MYLLWFIIAAFFFLMELGNPGFLFCLSFAVGALAAFGVSFFAENNFFLQSISFCVMSAVSFVVLRFVMHKELHQHSYRTNVDALLGCRGIVITDIPANQAGAVKIGGQVWAALSLHHEPLCRNMLVEVVQVRGVHLIVRPVIIV